MELRGVDSMFEMSEWGNIKGFIFVCVLMFVVWMCVMYVMFLDQSAGQLQLALTNWL